MKERNLDHRIGEAHVEEPRGVSRFEVERENIRLQEEAEGLRIAIEIMARAFAINAAATYEARMSGFSSNARIYRTADAYARYILTGAHPE
jgi:hypothetical protein